MAKKFDTNPLDPEFPEKVMEAQREVHTTNLRNQNGQTRQFAEPLETEEQTRKFNEEDFDSYQTNFGNEFNQPTSYQPKNIYGDDTDKNKSHNIGSISLPENILTALPYIPFAFIGLIAGIIELVFIPKSEPKVRYHAAQGAAAQIGVLIVTAILGFVSFGTNLAETASWIFSIVTTIMLIVFAVKAFQGKPIHIESVQDLTDWIEEKIKPQK
jgi:uncharacterized membrane protein